MIPRDKYLNQMIKRMNNGKIKIITGIRRCGKSVLMNNLFYDYLRSCGIPNDHIVCLSLEESINAKYRNPMRLDEHIRKIIADDEPYYILLDEIQNVVSVKNPWIDEAGSDERIGFPDVLMGLMKIRNVDLYVTGSNSKMLSTDVVTQFRDRGDEIHLYPLSFREFYDAYTGDKENAWREFYTYGGLPRILEFETHQEKADYLKSLFHNTYLKDVLERHDIRNDEEVLDNLLFFISSSIGSLTNPSRLSNTFKSTMNKTISSEAIKQYLDFFKEAFLISEAKRYDVKGRKYISTPLKYYFTDMGLRNAWLNYSQLEENHIMENILYNELIMRGYSVDVGVVEYQYCDSEKKKTKVQLEVDFVARNAGDTLYIQSALYVDTDAKREQEINSLKRINDSFQKIVVVRDHIMPYKDENGILFVGIKDFLLQES